MEHPESAATDKTKQGLHNYPVQGWQQDLHEVHVLLKELIAGRENEFLNIGFGVRELSQMARDLAQGAVDLAAQASGRSLQESMQELESSMGSILNRQGQADLQNIGAKCSALSKSISVLQKEMVNFRPILKHLRVLAMSIRIESARLGSEGGRFQILAQEVEALGQKTDTYSREVGNQTGRLLQELQQVQDRVEQAEAMQDSQVRPLLQRVQSGVDELARLQSLSERIAQNVSQRSQEIKNQIDEIYSSVQFHDITRQQVEHVQHVLQEVQDVLESEQKSDQQQERARDLVIWLGDVCELQSRQLEATKAELGRAMEQIRQSLQSISDAVEEQGTELKGFPGLVSQGGESVLSILEKDAAELRSILQKATKGFGEVITSLDSMTGILEETHGFLGTLQEIGEEIELIALNASNKSAHTGDSGRPLGVLAEAIRKLSQEVKQLLQRVALALQEISSVAEDFRSHAESARIRAREEENLCSTLDQVLSTINQANAQVEGLYQNLEQSSSNFLSRIQYLEQSLQLQFAVEKELDEVAQRLQAVKSSARENVPQDLQIQHSQRLDSILQRYTMESERLVHLSFSGQAAEESAQELEESWSPQETELGDNVELF